MKSAVLLLVVVAAAAAPNVPQCLQPWTPELCRATNLQCDTITQSNCATQNGTYLQGRGSCGCDLCAKYGGLGAPCNTTQTTLSPICEKPLRCSVYNVCVELCQEI